MKKSNLITGILYVLFGMACLIVALLIETKLESDYALCCMDKLNIIKAFFEERKL